MQLTWIIKTDSYGTVIWNITCGGTGNHLVYSITQSAAGGYFAVGYTNSFGTSGLDVFLVETNVEGKSGLAWTDSTATQLHRGTNDIYWNYVRVQVWKAK